VPPDSCSQKQETQPRRGQRGVFHGFHGDVLLAAEQLQPAVTENGPSTFDEGWATLANS